VKREPEYIEGPEATRNFELLASTILQRKTRKKKKQAKPASQKNQPKSDKG
jgi:hypothetical protein